MNTPATPVTKDILIVGAGFSGICLGVYLKKAGIHDFLIIEKANEAGGTWLFNRYPGCACDVQSHLYSFSFAPKHDWSKNYGDAEEIHTYLKHVVSQFGLSEHILFNQTVVSADYEEAKRQWVSKTDSGLRLEARFFINATGPLDLPNVPKIPGLDTFSGKVMHSARWDQTYDFSGKSVVSIGTGASAIQYLPELAKKCESLTVAQRSPAWVIPKINTPYDSFKVQRFKKFPYLAKLTRLYYYIKNEISFLPIVSEKFGKRIEKIVNSRIKRHVKDSGLWDKLTPNYRIGCKRILLSNDYYRMFNSENVLLVTDPIEKVKQTTVLFRDGKEIKADSIVFGTGFVTDPRIYLDRLAIRGKFGIELKDHWSKSPRAYLGITVDKFPNLFLIVGPNTGIGHNSLVYMIENQCRYIKKCLEFLKRRNYAAIEVTESAVANFNHWLKEQLDKTVWSSGCQSWYLGEDQVNFAIWPGPTITYSWKTRRPDFSKFVYS